MPNYDASYAQDRAEIEDLMARYLFAMDWNDFDSYADCFTEDGALDYARGTTEGRENIRAEAKRFKEQVGAIYTDVDGNPAVLRHLLTQKRDPGGGRPGLAYRHVVRNGKSRPATGRRRAVHAHRGYVRHL